MQNTKTSIASTRVSMDVDRPPIDPDILGTPQGWHDDLMIAMAMENPTHISRRTASHITPFRDRMKLLAASTRRRNDQEGAYIPPTVTSSSAPLIFSNQHVKQDRSRNTPGLKSVQLTLSEARTSHSGERSMGESVYRVGYEREVMDTEARLHATMHDLFDSHVFAKLAVQPKRVLDIGTGMGLWPIAQSRVWPETEFIGLDKAPCQLNMNIVKRRWNIGNISWTQADFLEPLPFKDAHFGYIHIRFIGLGVPEHQWPALLEECCRVLEPGGKVGIVESSYDIPDGPPSLRNSFASLLLSNLVAESPEHAINFALPMLSGVKPSSIHAIHSQAFENPPGALRDAPAVWVSSSLDYKASCKLQGGTLAQVKDSLGWSGSPAIDEKRPIRLWVWVIERLGAC